MERKVEFVDEYSQVEEQLPKNRKEDALQTVCNDTRLQSTAKQAQNAILENHKPSGLSCYTYVSNYPQHDLRVASVQEWVYY